MPFHYSLLIPKGFIYNDRDALQTKIARFKEAGAAQVHLVFDFDRTLTVPRHDRKEDITSWGILREHLPPQANQRCAELFTIYRAKELDGTMTNEDAVVWWSTVLDIYAEHRLDLKEVERDFLERASIRPGVAEVFSACQEYGIPTPVLSAGIKDVIDLWSVAYKIPLPLVISTVLELDDERKITGWNKDSLVHALNKDEMDHDGLREIKEARPMAIAVGDSINDADMVSGDENTIRIRIFDPRPDETGTVERERAATFERFDAMIETGSLAPLAQLLRQIANS